jgi:hypothetical protein
MNDENEFYQPDDDLLEEVAKGLYEGIIAGGAPGEWDALPETDIQRDWFRCIALDAIRAVHGTGRLQDAGYEEARDVACGCI